MIKNIAIVSILSLLLQVSFIDMVSAKTTTQIQKIAQADRLSVNEYIDRGNTEDLERMQG